MREVEVEVEHDGVVAVLVIEGEQLLREDTLGRGVTVILAPELGDAEAPVDVIGLNSVGEPLDVEDLLIRDDAIGIVVVGSGRVGTVALVGGADVEAAVEPAVDLGTAYVLVDGLHEDVGLGVGRADDGSSTDGVICAGKGAWNPAGHQSRDALERRLEWRRERGTSRHGRRRQDARRSCATGVAAGRWLRREKQVSSPD